MFLSWVSSGYKPGNSNELERQIGAWRIVLLNIKLKHLRCSAGEESERADISSTIIVEEKHSAPLMFRNKQFNKIWADASSSISLTNIDWKSLGQKDSA